MSFDAEAHRESSRAGWEDAAAGWVSRQEMVRQWTAPVSHWMLAAAAPQSGEQVLELAAGLGETGMLAAELVMPIGGVIISDQAEAMLAGARARASELGLTNVEFRQLNAEWIDLPLASVDVVLCRWGYMLLADPAAALAESRRVLRPGGRLALAVWDAVTANPWALLPGLELRERGIGEPPDPTRPGPFALGDPDRVRGLLEEAGFSEIRVEAIELSRRQSFEDLWETSLDLSPSFHDGVLSQPAEAIAEIKASLRERFAPYATADGTLAVGGRTLVAVAGA